ncbi:hypothetical protein [Sphingomonas morindae]|uniref:Uncharacterized protein n=1 Tax=Sphingomonas morindae TaxID=1541170 RepID=A0ABY4XAE7_9SPHN|nr:hypothetical protein [Sphingomonas morindae]USI73937.1 hypothetical protein LHA26_05580 [Sphingomonas morindae]
MTLLPCNAAGSNRRSEPSFPDDASVAARSSGGRSTRLRDGPRGALLRPPPLRDPAEILDLAEKMRRRNLLPGVRDFAVRSARGADREYRHVLIGRAEAGADWIVHCPDADDGDVERRLAREHAIYVGARLVGEDHLKAQLRRVQPLLQVGTDEDPELLWHGVHVPTGRCRIRPDLHIGIRARGGDTLLGTELLVMGQDCRDRGLNSILDTHVAAAEVAANWEARRAIAAVDMIAFGLMQSFGIRLRDVIATLQLHGQADFKAVSEVHNGGHFAWRDFRIEAHLDHELFILEGNTVELKPTEIYPENILTALGGVPLGKLMEIPLIPPDLKIARAVNRDGRLSIELNSITRLVNGDSKLLPPRRARP